MMEPWIIVIMTIVILIDLFIAWNIYTDFYDISEKSAFIFLMITAILLSVYIGTHIGKMEEFEHNYRDIDITQTNLYQMWMLEKEK